MVLNHEGTMLGSLYMSLAVLRDWVAIRKIWPAVVLAQHTEKPAIQGVVDRILKRIEQNFETLQFDFKVRINHRRISYYMPIVSIVS